MKKKLLILVFSVAFIGCSYAQIAPQSFYKDGTKTIALAYSDNNLKFNTDSTGGTVTPFEGATQYVLKYANLGGWGTGLANFTLGPYVETPVGSGNYVPQRFDFTAYTHVQIAWRGETANAPASVLKLYFEDGTNASNAVIFGTPSTTATYQVSTIPISSFGTGVDWTIIKNGVFVLDQLGSAIYSIDNFRLLDCSAPAPTITSFTPSAEVGQTITINGTNLLNITTVSFNGISTGRISNVTNTSFDVVVPSGATDGTITINTCGSATTGTSFDVLAPTVTSFSPTSAAIGATITISGTNLSNVSSVSFNGGVSTSFANITATSFDVIVPVAAVNGTITVTTPSGTGVSSSSFTITTVIPAPTITSISPTSGAVGDVITITGTNLSNTTGIKFNGLNAPTYTIVSATSITVTVPAGATDGLIAVTTTTGSANSASFDVQLPTLTSFSPTSGIVGGTITLTGTNLSGVSNVSFNGGNSTAISNVTATSLNVKVPVGASTGLITITTPSGTSISSSNWRLDSLDVYTDHGDSLDNLWNGNADCIPSKVSDPTNAFEGDSVLTFQYKITSATSAAGYYAGFGGDIGAPNGFDLTKFTHMKINVKGTSASYPSNVLVLAFIDAQGKTSTAIQIGQISSSYSLHVFNLLSQIKKDSTNFNLTQVKKFFVYVGGLAGQFQPNNSYFYIDNFKFVYDPSLGGPTVPTSIVKQTASMNVTVSPNPSSGVYNINTNEEIDGVTIFNSMGAIISNSSDLQIDLTNQPNGLYFINMSSEGRSIIKKVIKN